MDTKGDEESFAQVIQRTELSERDILNFRLSSLFPYLIDQLTQLTHQEHQPPAIGSYLKFLSLCCRNYDFSYQFGDFGGHLLLKKILKSFPDFSDECYELISVISSSGCGYPMTKNILYQEEIMKPLIYQFKRRQHMGQEKAEEQEEQQRPFEEEFTVILRQIPSSMHGEGQIAVGYIIWSAALILSRWIAFNSLFFDQKSVLEIGAGTGLCGIVAGACGASVVISDYTDIILRNISENILLNRKGTLCQGTEGCLYKTSYAEVLC
jgi:hypothetical protein